jgi:heme a synthase
MENFVRLQLFQNMNVNLKVYRWLLTGCWLIFIMVVVGGITRLTQSGLSMVEWKPITGFLPPMNEMAWNHEFNLYKKSPEFNFYNKDFSLHDFKQIYFWEYIHRLIARLMGLVFIFPAIYFWIKKQLTLQLKKRLVVIFIWGLLQGVIGWYMVKSGLSKDPHVSHYRLALHLITALLLMGYIYYSALLYRYPSTRNLWLEKRRWYIIAGMLLLNLQIIYGALVAGLKAGKMYTTFPKMGAVWLPKEFKIYYFEHGVSSFVEHPGIVQLIHRALAFLVCFSWLFYYWTQVRRNSNEIVEKYFFQLGFLLLFQVLLGISTLVMQVPISLGVLHQATAILLWMLLIRYYFGLKQKV